MTPLPKYYYGVYVSPYCHDGLPYVGSPKESQDECYAACGTDEDILGVVASEAEARYLANHESIIMKLRAACNANNLQFRREWVNINKELGYANVINDSGHILARIDL